MLRFLALALVLACAPARAQLMLRDDMGRSLLVRHASRIVTLAPFITEAVFASGAGDLVIAVDPFSDYPPEAARLPKITTGTSFSVERVAALKPDLVFAWRDGILAKDVDRMTEMGMTVYLAQARHLDDVPHLLDAIRQFTGRDTRPLASRFVDSLAALERANAGRPKLGVFLEIWNRPLTTVSGDHFLSEAVEICRGENVFGRLVGVAPRVEWDEVRQINPFVIVGVGSASNADEFRANWALRPAVAAVQARRLIYLDSEALQRPTVRTPEAIAALCAELDQVRVRAALISPSDAARYAETPAPPSVLRVPMTALERDVAAAMASRNSVGTAPAAPAAVASKSAAASPAPAPAPATAPAPAAKEAVAASPAVATKEPQPEAAPAARRPRPSQFGM